MEEYGEWFDHAGQSAPASIDEKDYIQVKWLDGDVTDLGFNARKNLGWRQSCAANGYIIAYRIREDAPSNWQPKPGDTVMVVNPKGLDLTKAEKDVIGENVIFHTTVKSESGSIPIGVIEDDGGDFYCFRMDMLAQPVDPRRAVLEAVFAAGASYMSQCSPKEHKTEGFKKGTIQAALQKLDNLPPF